MDIDVFHDNLELYRVFATGHTSRKIAVSNMYNFSKVKPEIEKAGVWSSFLTDLLWSLMMKKLYMLFILTNQEHRLSPNCLK